MRIQYVPDRPRRQPDATSRRAPPSRGFTLIELLVVIAILGIMAGLAAPSMSQLIANQRVRAIATDLQLALVKARAEAIKRNRDVTVAPTGGSWTAGWSIVDPENPGGPALDARGPSPSLAVATSVTQVVYSASGRATAAGGSSFVFSSTATAAARCLSIDASGRPYVKEGSSC
jgi:type IV fimbrial biogenesis protein FimT